MPVQINPNVANGIQIIALPPLHLDAKNYQKQSQPCDPQDDEQVAQVGKLSASKIFYQCVQRHKDENQHT
jgi:hypothetical protein